MVERGNSNLKNCNSCFLIASDALKALRKLPDKYFSAVITSPPYWGIRDYGVKGQIGLEDNVHQYVLNLAKVFREVKRVLKDNGTIWLNIGDSYASGNRKYRANDKKYGARSMSIRPKNPKGIKNKDLIGVPWRLAFKLQQESWYLRSDIIWYKPNAMPESVKDRPHRNHEYLFLFSKKECYYFNNEGLKNCDGSKMRSVWKIARNSYNGNHFATFPESLVLPCIKSSTKKYDYVLDPFCGVGTVGKICNKLNRGFVGIDLNKEYINEAQKVIVTSTEILMNELKTFLS
ncbi:MAG: site-specific DNA-methyltransferase [Desulfobacterales bacterium]|nr:site-specific DNA-methyltransferase [Desulfobacterales bacterium]